jgi:hypothetical protein
VLLKNDKTFCKSKILQGNVSSISFKQATATTEKNKTIPNQPKALHSLITCKESVPIPIQVQTAKTIKNKTDTATGETLQKLHYFRSLHWTSSGEKQENAVLQFPVLFPMYEIIKDIATGIMQLVELWFIHIGYNLL